MRLGPYEILTPLGAGGMGEVYRAKDTRLERTVAVKVLPSHMSASPEVRQRFEREAKTISQLSHPHICALYDVGREGETEYLVMEYLEGETLSDRLAKGSLPLETTLRFGQEIADALDKAHRQGIVHRDLKPGNVMLTKSGVKLLDFGLAKAMAPAAPQSALTSLPTQQGLTQEGTILGTFQYMAPEQLEGKEADARTDIWAFGCVLYEMATGKKAFSASSQASLISAIMQQRSASDLHGAADVAAGARPCRQDLPRQGPRGPVAERCTMSGSEMKWIAREGRRPGMAAPTIAPDGAIASGSPGASPACSPPRRCWRSPSLLFAARRLLAARSVHFQVPPPGTRSSPRSAWPSRRTGASSPSSPRRPGPRTVSVAAAAGFSRGACARRHRRAPC